MSDCIRILFVDDEAQMLTALGRVFRGKRYETHTANSGAEGIDLIKSHKFDVIISDMRMPEMDGAAFLAQTITLTPDSRRILLTGYSDQESTIRAINEGQVHQYMTKPWDNEELKQTVEKEFAAKQELSKSDPNSEDQSILKQQVESVASELANTRVFADLAKDELLKQYNTTIKMISNMLSQRISTPWEMDNNVVNHSVAMAKLIKLDNKNITEIRNAARLYQIGKMLFPDAILGKTLNEMNSDERAMYDNFPSTGADMLAPLSTLDFAANIIRYQNENMDGSGMPDGLKGKEIPLGSRILRIVVDFQQLIHGQQFTQSLSFMDALEYMGKYISIKYDPVLLQLYTRFIQRLIKRDNVPQDKLKHVEELEAGLITTRDVITETGILLVAKGTTLTETLISKLNLYQQRSAAQIAVFVKPQEEPEEESETN
ncbi:response regulator [Bermanella marisrubri]|uniref:Response regulator n=1 Tax=Bermanella marisrubri TaxID=207949 RepID=Q1N037_9GAMM|nr:HD domain-containing phosphohydrolase [Bermanella marisrubri]EAT11526.1 response regulator [Oceanobacter sp. RED65] [Bermanella marisrubri]QIZ85009.1 response regulator [Bermanella marisrubri]